MVIQFKDSSALVMRNMQRCLHLYFWQNKGSSKHHSTKGKMANDIMSDDGGKKAGCLLSEMLCIKLEHIVPYLTDIRSRKNRVLCLRLLIILCSPGRTADAVSCADGVSSTHLTYISNKDGVGELGQTFKVNKARLYLLSEG